MPNASLQTLTRKTLSGSTLTQPEQIAREILNERGNPSILTPSEISEMRAEVKRRLAFKWQQAA